MQNNRRNFSDCFVIFFGRSREGGIVVRPNGLNQGYVVRIPAEKKRPLQSIQTSYETHPASYLMGTAA